MPASYLKAFFVIVFILQVVDSISGTKPECKSQPADNVSHPLTLFRMFDSFSFVPQEKVVKRQQDTIREEEMMRFTSFSQRNTKRTTTKQIQFANKPNVEKLSERSNVSISHIFVCSLAGVLFGWVMMECFNDSEVVAVDDDESAVASVKTAKSLPTGCDLPPLSSKADGKQDSDC